MSINTRSLVAQIAGMFLAFTLAVFLSAGTIVWYAGWAFHPLFFGCVVAINL